MRRGTLFITLLLALMASPLRAQTNFERCRDGLSGCNPRFLSAQELRIVRIYEDGRNVSACANGDGRCDWSRLTDQQLVAVREAQVRQSSSAVLPVPKPPSEPTAPPVNSIQATRVSSPTLPPSATPAATAPAVAENGSYYGEPNQNGVPKTVYVHGYYRKDGTYVRSYYRSAPGSNPPSTGSSKKSSGSHRKK